MLGENGLSNAIALLTLFLLLGAMLFLFGGVLSLFS